MGQVVVMKSQKHSGRKRCCFWAVIPCKNYLLYSHTVTGKPLCTEAAWTAVKRGFQSYKFEVFLPSILNNLKLFCQSKNLLFWALLLAKAVNEFSTPLLWRCEEFTWNGSWIYLDVGQAQPGHAGVVPKAHSCTIDPFCPFHLGMPGPSPGLLAVLTACCNINQFFFCCILGLLSMDLNIRWN